jgi:hypothetical protein
MSRVIQRPKANQWLMVHPDPGMTHGIPVFFEPLDADKVMAATREHARTVVVLDGERPLGHDLGRVEPRYFEDESVVLRLAGRAT